MTVACSLARTILSALAPLAVVIASTVAVRADGLAIDADIGGGVRIHPRWDGSSHYELAPYPLFSLRALEIPGLLSIGGSDLGFSVAPSLGFISSRKASTDHALQGLPDVAAAYEIGAKVSYRWEHARILAEARQGFGGYSGLVGSIGADAIWSPWERLTLEAGPRLGLAGDSYMSTYFGVDAAQAAASGFEPHAAGAGVKSVGLESRATLRLSPVWSAVADFDYDRLVADAATSPLVAAAGRDQFSFGLGLTYRLQWNAFSASKE